jgi:hypothetical protein
MGTRSNSKLACARGVGRERRLLGWFILHNQGCAEWHDGHDFARDDPRGGVPYLSTADAYLTVSDSLICLL